MLYSCMTHHDMRSTVAASSPQNMHKRYPRTARRGSISSPHSRHAANNCLVLLIMVSKLGYLNKPPQLPAGIQPARWSLVLCSFSYLTFLISITLLTLDFRFTSDWLGGFVTLSSLPSSIVTHCYIYVKCLGLGNVMERGADAL